MIKFLERIDWDLVVSSKKNFVGLSDFSHFSILAVNKGVRCYYGLALRNIRKYYADEKLGEIARFIKSISGQSDDDPAELAYAFKDEIIIGGILAPTVFMLEHYDISLENKHLFIEHHYIPGETFDDLEYYLDQLLLTIGTNRPKSIILGHTMLFNSEGGLIDHKEINVFIAERFFGTGLPVSEVDHFLTPIQLG